MERKGSSRKTTTPETPSALAAVETKALSTTETYMKAALMAIATAVSNSALAPKPAGQLLKMVRQYQKNFEAFEEALRARLINILKDAPDHTVVEDGVTLKMYNGRTGYDPKKVEALLRAKKKDPAHYMDPTITYKVNEPLLRRAIGNEVLTEEELETCRYAPSWRVESPTWHEDT
jgi:hypothetical protein